MTPLAVGAYIGAAYWFTSSTSFANPAVTVGRAFSDTFAGIAPSSVPGFAAAQVVGLLAGVAANFALYPQPRNPVHDPEAGVHHDDIATGPDRRPAAGAAHGG